MAHSIEMNPVNDHQTPLLSQFTSDEIEEWRKVDHCHMFGDLDKLSMKWCTIPRVNAGLRESNPDAYTPKLVSIGPYHKNKEQLRPMEKYKRLYLKRFLQRKGTVADVGIYMNVLAKRKEEALNCYDDIEDLYLCIDQFMGMLVLDGCFVVEFIREQFKLHIPEGEHEIISVHCTVAQIVRDLLLLENQLPFFVLRTLYDMTNEDDGSPVVLLMAQIAVGGTLPKIFDIKNAVNFKHLLHMVHTSCLPLEAPNTSRLIGESSCKSFRLIGEILVKAYAAIFCKQLGRKKSQKISNYILVMPNATELSEAGVSFENIRHIYRDVDIENLVESTSSSFDIKFENGVMKIPSFEVNDNTESYLRNLIAYEQQSSDVGPRYFSNYVIFMDALIDSEKDVRLLRQRLIIASNIGDDKEVASFFNKLPRGVKLSGHYYEEQSKKAVQYYKKPWNQMKANLKRNYFSSPWVGASTIAAIVLLILTAMQTVLAFFK